MNSISHVDEIEDQATDILIDIIKRAIRAKYNKGEHEYSFYYTDFQACFRDCVKMLDKSCLKELSNTAVYDGVFDNVTEYLSTQQIEFDPAFDQKILNEKRDERKARKPVFTWGNTISVISFYDWLMNTHTLLEKLKRENYNKDVKTKSQFDIAGYIAKDECFPKDVKTLQACEDHLFLHNAPTEALDALEERYNDYVKLACQNKIA